MHAGIIIAMKGCDTQYILTSLSSLLTSTDRLQKKNGPNKMQTLSPSPPFRPSAPLRFSAKCYIEFLRDPAGLPQLLMVPVLFFTLMAGPTGVMAYTAMRTFTGLFGSSHALKTS